MHHSYLYLSRAVDLPQLALEGTVLPEQTFNYTIAGQLLPDVLALFWDSVFIFFGCSANRQRSDWSVLSHYDSLCGGLRDF